MNTLRWAVMMTLVAGLLLAGCGRQTPPAQPVTDTAVTAVPAAEEPAVLEQGEEAELQKMETAAPAYQPVTRANYQAELANMESEVNAENQ